MKLFILLTIICMFGLYDSVLSQDILITVDDLESNETLKREKNSDIQHIIITNNTYTLFRFNGENYDTLTSIADDDSKYDISKYAFYQNESYKIAIIGNNSTEKEFNVLFTEAKSAPTPGESNSRLIQTPIPNFSIYSNGLEGLGKLSKKNRYIIIDAVAAPIVKSNTQLLKREEDRGVSDSGKGDTNLLHKTTEFSTAKGIPQNGSIAVLIRGYNFHDLESATVWINESNYSYEKGLADTYSDSKGIQEGANTDIPNGVSGDGTSNTDYLSLAKESIIQNKYLNINDVYVLELYKNKLENEIDTLGIKFSPEDLKTLGEILNFSPEYVSFTPIALSAEDADELEINLSLKTTKEATSKEYDLGSYMVSGGVDFDISSTLFITGLVNHTIYTDSTDVQVNDTTNVQQLRAKIDDSNKMSVGIGLNSEISFKTGSLIRPLVGIGFFVPFDEDITPNIAFGIGFSINSEKVKLSMSGGPAIGKVNAIAGRYKDKDLSEFASLANEDISTKVWDTSWQLGIGLSYNLNK